MKSAGERIDAARARVGVAKRELARRLGKETSEVLRWLSGKVTPSGDTVGDIAKALGVSVGEFYGEAPTYAAEPGSSLRILTVSEARKEYVSRAEQSLDFVPVRYVDGEIAAGPPRDIEENVKGYCVIYRSWCRNPEDHVCIKVSGSSMAPIIGHGYIVAVDLSQRDPDQLNGEIVAVANEEGATLRRLRVHEGGAVGVPENWSKAHPVLPIGGRDGARIVGRATWWWGHQ